MTGGPARREGPPLLLLAAFTIAVATLARPLPVPPLVRAAAATGIVLLFPGAGLYLLWPGLSRHGWPLGLGLSLPLSLIGVLFASAVGAAIDWRPLSLVAAYLFGGFLLAVAALILAGRRRVLEPARPGSRALLAVLAAGVVLAAVAGAPTGPATDGPDHLATVNRILLDGELFPRHAVLPPGDLDRTDPRKGIFHVALAMAAALAGVPASTVWRVAPAVLVLPWLALVWGVGLRLGLSRRAAILAAVLALLFTGGIPAAWAPKLAYGGHVGLLVAWGATWVLLGLLEEFATSSWILLGLLIATAAAVHPMAPAFLFLPLLGMCCFRNLGRDVFLRLMGAAAAVVVSLPVLVWRLTELRGPRNPLHDPAMPTLELGGAGSVLAPAYLVAWLGPLGILGMLLLPGVKRWVPSPRGRAWLVSSGLVAVAPSVIPGLFDASATLTSSLPIKLLYATPFPWLVAAFLDGPWRGRALWTRALVAFGIAALLPFALARFAPDRVAGARPAGADEILRELRAIRPPTVVAADPWMSCLVAAETAHRPVTVFQQHGSPVDPQGLDRLNRLGAALSPWVSGGESARRLDAEGVTLVLVPVPRGAPLEIDYGAARGGWLDEGRAQKFRTGPFTPVATGSAWDIYRVITGRWEYPPAVWHAGRDGPRGDAVGEDDGRAAGVRLTALESPPRLVPGETAQAVLWWERDPVVSGRPVEAHLRLTRLDTETPWRPWRLFSEHVIDPSQPRARQRVAAPPFLGAWPAPAWPAGVAMADTLRFQVLPTLAPGRYALAVRVEEQPMFSRMGVGDLLGDEDRWQGAPLCTVLVDARSP